ncbi:MAG: hypothetical protein IANPNBLG_00095 [Bryobacteraceae bacterium]|nr:hypothetical protein [Bryobacteraceae bacterium]
MLVLGQALAGDRALIDAREARRHHSVGRDAFARLHENVVARLQVLDVHFHFSSVTEQARLARHLGGKAANGGVGSSRGVCFEAFADEDDEHGFGGGHVLAGGESGHHGDADRQVSGDLFFQQRGDGIVESLIAGQHRDDGGGINSEYGAEDSRHVENQQRADECGEEIVAYAFARFLGGRLIIFRPCYLMHPAPSWPLRHAASLRTCPR